MGARLPYAVSWRPPASWPRYIARVRNKRALARPLPGANAPGLPTRSIVKKSRGRLFTRGRPTFYSHRREAGFPGIPATARTAEKSHIFKISKGAVVTPSSFLRIVYVWPGAGPRRDIRVFGRAARTPGGCVRNIEAAPRSESTDKKHLVHITGEVRGRGEVEARPRWISDFYNRPGKSRVAGDAAGGDMGARPSCRFGGSVSTNYPSIVIAEGANIDPWVRIRPTLDYYGIYVGHRRR